MRSTALAGGREHGFAMAALLVGLSIMAVVSSVALPVWQTVAIREREAELVFRGEQYARAVGLYQRSRGAFPPNVDVLVSERFLRKKYRDPMSPDGEFQLIYVGQPLPGEGAVTQGGRAGGQGAVAGRATPGQLAADPAGSGRGSAMGRGGATVGTANPARGSSAPSFGAPGQTGGGAVLGVVSKNKQASLREYNGRTKYSEWAFVPVQATQQGGTGAGPAVQPGGRGPVGGRGLGGRSGAPAPGAQGGGFGRRGGLPTGGRMGSPGPP